MANLCQFTQTWDEIQACHTIFDQMLSSVLDFVTLTLKPAYLHCIFLISRGIWNNRRVAQWFFLCIKITGSVSMSRQPTMSTMERRTLHVTTVLISPRLFTKFCHASVEFINVCILIFSLYWPWRQNMLYFLKNYLTLVVLQLFKD